MTEQAWEQAERVKFEAWIRMRYSSNQTFVRESQHGYYDRAWIQHRWYGWIAAKQESRKEIADAIEGARCSDHDQLNVEIARLLEAAARQLSQWAGRGDPVMQRINAVLAELAEAKG